MIINSSSEELEPVICQICNSTSIPVKPLCNQNVFQLVQCDICLAYYHQACYFRSPDHKKVRCDRCQLKEVDQCCVICNRGIGILKKISKTSYAHILCILTSPVYQINQYQDFQVSEIMTEQKQQECSLCLKKTKHLLMCQLCPKKYHFACRKSQQDFVALNFQKNQKLKFLLQGIDSSMLSAPLQTIFRKQLQKKPYYMKRKLIVCPDQFSRYSWCSCDMPQENDEQTNPSVMCDGCDRYIHLRCSGLSSPDEKQEFYCVGCKKMQIYKRNMRLPQLLYRLIWLQKKCDKGFNLKQLKFLNATPFPYSKKMQKQLAKSIHSIQMLLCCLYIQEKIGRAECQQIEKIINLGKQFYSKLTPTEKSICEGLFPKIAEQFSKNKKSPQRQVSKQRIDIYASNDGKKKKDHSHRNKQIKNKQEVHECKKKIQNGNAICLQKKMVGTSLKERHQNFEKEAKRQFTKSACKQKQIEDKIGKISEKICKISEQNDEKVKKIWSKFMQSPNFLNSIRQSSNKQNLIIKMKQTMQNRLKIKTQMTVQSILQLLDTKMDQQICIMGGQNKQQSKQMNQDYENKNMQNKMSQCNSNTNTISPQRKQQIKIDHEPVRSKQFIGAQIQAQYGDKKFKHLAKVVGKFLQTDYGIQKIINIFITIRKDNPQKFSQKIDNILLFWISLSQQLYLGQPTITMTISSINKIYKMLRACCYPDNKILKYINDRIHTSLKIHLDMKMIRNKRKNLQNSGSILIDRSFLLCKQTISNANQLLNLIEMCKKEINANCQKCQLLEYLDQSAKTMRTKNQKQYDIMQLILSGTYQNLQMFAESCRKTLFFNISIIQQYRIQNRYVGELCHYKFQKEATRSKLSASILDKQEKFIKVLKKYLPNLCVYAENDKPVFAHILSTHAQQINYLKSSLRKQSNQRFLALYNQLLSQNNELLTKINEFQKNPKSLQQLVTLQTRVQLSIFDNRAQTNDIFANLRTRMINFENKVIVKIPYLKEISQEYVLAENYFKSDHPLVIEMKNQRVTKSYIVMSYENDCKCWRALQKVHGALRESVKNRILKPPNVCEDVLKFYQHCSPYLTSVSDFEAKMINIIDFVGEIFSWPENNQDCNKKSKGSKRNWFKMMANCAKLFKNNLKILETVENYEKQWINTIIDQGNSL